MNTYKNRYGDKFQFEPVAHNQYKLVGTLNHCRYGGREDVEGVDMHDLGYVDPSGGPFMGIGDLLPTTNKRISKIGVYSSDIIFEVESD